METATSEPLRFVAGDTVKWTISDLSDYPIAEGWALSYALRSASDSIDLGSTHISTVDGNHAVTLPTTMTASMDAGVWTWAKAVSKDAERYTLAIGRFTVESVEQDTSLEEELAAIRAALREGSQVAAFTLNGRTVTYRTSTELRQREAVLADAIRRKNGGSFLTPVSYGFR